MFHIVHAFSSVCERFLQTTIFYGELETVCYQFLGVYLHDSDMKKKPQNKFWAAPGKKQICITSGTYSLHDVKTEEKTSNFKKRKIKMTVMKMVELKEKNTNLFWIYSIFFQVSAILLGLFFLPCELLFFFSWDVFLCVYIFLITAIKLRKKQFFDLSSLKKLF